MKTTNYVTRTCKLQTKSKNYKLTQSPTTNYKQLRIYSSRSLPSYTRGKSEPKFSHFNVAQKCQVIMNRLFRLGARCPSEPTYAMVTAVILLVEPERFNDPLQLRSSYLTVKGICKTNLTNKIKALEGPPSSIQKALPPVREALPKDLLQVAYKETGDSLWFETWTTVHSNFCAAATLHHGTLSYKVKR